MTATISNVHELKEFFSKHWDLLTDESFKQIVKGMFKSHAIGKPNTLQEALNLIDKNEHNLNLKLSERRLFFI